MPDGRRLRPGWLVPLPQSDFFRVWTSFMFVDKDLWKLKLFLPNKSVTKSYICEWIYKSCLIKIHKVTSLEYEPVCLLAKIWHIIIWLIILEKKQFLCQICNSTFRVFIRHMILKILFGRNSFCVRFVTQLQEWTLMFSVSWFWPDKFW